MIRDSRQEELLTKQGGGTNVDKFPVSSRLWSALKNPRIVRVSRTFGGKDRHSKVRTIRGLRDRRVRLSVPTAIQLYDLQDKLGVNQPSKVVDWLINAAQHEIDKLPPLQLPPGNFTQLAHESMAISHKLAPPQAPSFHGDSTEFIHDDRAFQLASSSSVANGDMLDNNTVEINAMMVQKSTFWNSDVLLKNKEKEAMKESSIEKGSMIKGNDVGIGLQHNAMSYPFYHHWDPSNAHISYLGNHSSQAEGFHNYQPVSMFASYMNSPTEFNAKQYKHLHMDNSTSQLLPSNSLRTSFQSGDPSLELLQPNLAFKHHPPQNHQD